MSGLDYPVTIRRLSEEEGGGYLAEFPDLPGCMADGETIEEAIAEGQDAVAAWIGAAKEDGRAIPKPGTAEAYSGKFIVRVPKMLHARLAARARIEDVSLNQYVNTVLAEALGRAFDTSTARLKTNFNGARQREVAHAGDKPGPDPFARKKGAAAKAPARRKR
jgi:antitoxin HicB